MLFTPLEIKRVVDATSRYFIEAFLVNQILQAGRWPSEGSAQARRVITRVCREVGTGPLELLLGQALRGTGHKLREIVSSLLVRLRRVKSREPEKKEAAVAEALADVEAEHGSQLDAMLEAWMVWLRQLPRDYRNQLTRAVLEGLQGL
jgi:hypothetical protein